MPWLTCTTGSPTFSSERSLISALTSLVCSWRFRRRRARRHREELGLGDELDRPRVAGGVGRATAKPCASGATAIAKRSSPASNSASVATLGGSIRLSRSSSSRLSRRPSLSATMQDAMRRRRDVALQPLERLGRAAVDAQVGQRRSPMRRRSSSAPRTQRAAPASPQAVKNSSGFRNSASGASSGRSRSCWKKRWRSRVSAQKRCSASSTSPCSTTVAARAEVVEERRGLVEEERQVVLDAGGRDAGADVLVEAHLGRIALEALAPARAKGVARRLVHRELAARAAGALRAPDRGCAGCRDRRCGSNRSRRRTGRRGTAPPSPSGRGRSGRRARVLAGRDDLAHVRVAGERELRLQRRFVEALLRS